MHAENAKSINIFSSSVNNSSTRKKALYNIYVKYVKVQFCSMHYFSLGKKKTDLKFLDLGQEKKCIVLVFIFIASFFNVMHGNSFFTRNNNS